MAGTDRAIPLIIPDWPAPDSVGAASSTRAGGISDGVYRSLNVGDHVGDNGHAVQSNRRALMAKLGLTDRPRWLEQVHGTTIVAAEGIYEPPQADGAIACTGGVACVVMTADCLPVLFCDRGGTHVAAVHAGWRGLAAGILEAALAAFSQRGMGPENLLAWLGPAIGKARYEVGDDVRAAFGSGQDDAFAPIRAGRWQFDLVALARRHLTAAGVAGVYGGAWCTASDARFYSHRRDGPCGRQATLIWLKS